MNTPNPVPIHETSTKPSPRNPVVERCCAARERSLEQSRIMNHNSYERNTQATSAYCNAMPDLSGYENIRDFIACVARGMVVGTFNDVDGPKLLYAAQVALGLLRHEPKPRTASPAPSSIASIAVSAN